MKVVKWLDNNLEEFFMIIFLIMISVIMMLQVIMRYAFSSSLNWAEEACRHLWIATTCLSIGYCTKKKSALRVDMIIEMLPGVLKKIMIVFIDLIGIAAYGYLFVESITTLKGTIASGQTSTALEMPMWILFLFLMIGFFLATVRAVEQLIERFTKKEPRVEAGGEEA